MAKLNQHNTNVNISKRTKEGGNFCSTLTSIFDDECSSFSDEESDESFLALKSPKRKDVAIQCNKIKDDGDLVQKLKRLLRKPVIEKKDISNLINFNLESDEATSSSKCLTERKEENVWKERHVHKGDKTKRSSTLKIRNCESENVIPPNYSFRKDETNVQTTDQKRKYEKVNQVVLELKNNAKKRKSAKLSYFRDSIEDYKREFLKEMNLSKNSEEKKKKKIRKSTIESENVRRSGRVVNPPKPVYVTNAVLVIGPKSKQFFKSKNKLKKTPTKNNEQPPRKDKKTNNTPLKQNTEDKKRKEKNIQTETEKKSNKKKKVQTSKTKKTGIVEKKQTVDQGASVERRRGGSLGMQRFPNNKESLGFRSLQVKVRRRLYSPTKWMNSAEFTSLDRM